MISEEEFQFFDLDPHRLDEEWLAQPRHFSRLALKLAGAKADYDRAKSDTEVVAAELDHHIRSHPEQFGVGKVTDKSVEKAVLLQKRYHDANTKELEARRLVYELSAVVDALDHRKKALENLVELWIRDYFSTPRSPQGVQGREHRGRLEELENQDVTERTRKSLNRVR